MIKLVPYRIPDRIALLRDCLVGPPVLPYLEVPGENIYSHKWNQNYKTHAFAPNLRFIHIGKCGGTTIMAEFFEQGIYLEQDHLRKPRQLPGWVFLWVRHPITRFVSAFNFAKSLVEFDPSGLDPDKLTLDNCPEPGRIRKKITQGYTFTPEYDALITKFESANALAESLSSSEPRLENQAEELFCHPKEHISKGIGFYLSNGRWVARNSRRILFVGCLETMTQDFRRLTDILGWENLAQTIPSHRRSGSPNYSTDLSPTARRNLVARFQKTEYPALQALVKYGHLTRERIDEYMK